MKRKSLAHDCCPVARALDAIGDWWSLLIIRDALAGTRRFSEFQRGLGLARNILSARLRKLVEQGIMRTEPAADGSAYREYVLTEKGNSLQLVIIALLQWGESSLFEPGEPASRLVDRLEGKAIAPLRLMTLDGRILAPGDLRVMPPNAPGG
jgi:DNA-binding HxlR family transcriptional regulator